MTAHAPAILTSDKSSTAIDRAMLRLINRARVMPLRSMRQFAESEIILPTGPYQGERFKVSRQPWTGLWFDAIDSGQWRRFNLTGPSQSSKTLSGSAIPVLYHAFEGRETTIYAAPTMEMCGDKWRQDVLPLILATKYRDLLPTRGDGSKGGTVTAIQFKHGPTLKFMAAGGGDKARAGFTSRVVVVTETDAFDEAGGSSREADKLSQIEARGAAFGDRAITYMECTISTEEGRTWQELKRGSDSRIILPCPHCLKWVTPEREHLIGWQEAADVNEAAARAALACPSCGATWTEENRIDANQRGLLVHRGQSVDEGGTIVGMLPATQTLAMRSTVANNLLTSMSHIGTEEWTASKQADQTLAEKKMRQFFWALPSESETLTLTALDVSAIVARVIDVPRGRIPGDATKLTIGVDCGKWLHHWVAVAWRPDGTPHVLEYGRLEVPSNSMGEELAIITALRRFRDEVCATGWPSTVTDQPNMRPALTIIDAGHWEGVIIPFCRESGAGYLPSKSFGAAQIGRRKLMRDPGYELCPQPAGHNLLEANSDTWKTYIHARLQTPVGRPGAITLFHASPTEHLSFAKHLTAEKKVEEFIAGDGLVTRWEAINRNNHYLDAIALACVAGHGVGIRIVETVAPPPPAPSNRSSRPEPNPLTSHRGKW